MERKCQECGEQVAGRSDKKFCSDQCRTSFHNRQNSASDQLLRHVNGILKRNRCILARLNDSGKTLVTRQRLSANGFDFRYFTSCSTTISGQICFFCYEQGYFRASEGKFVLVRKANARRRWPQRY